MGYESDRFEGNSVTRFPTSFWDAHYHEKGLPTYIFFWGGLFVQRNYITTTKRTAKKKKKFFLTFLSFRIIWFANLAHFFLALKGEVFLFCFVFLKASLNLLQTWATQRPTGQGQGESVGHDCTEKRLVVRKAASFETSCYSGKWAHSISRCRAHPSHSFHLQDS